MGILGSARAQSSIEFLTTYGFALLAIAAGIAIVFTITATTRSDTSSQCSAYGSITCNLAYYYSPSGSQYSIIVLSVTNAQESAINITNTIVTISQASYVGICSPNLLLPGQEATCMAKMPQGSGQGASKSGFFTVNANFCNTPHDLLPSGCTQAAAYSGTFYTYVQPSPITVFSAIASRGNSSIQLPALGQGPQIPNTSQITGSGDWVGVQEPHAVAYVFGTSGYSPVNLFGASMTNFPSSLSFLSGNAVSCSQGYNTSLSTAYTTIYQPSADPVYFNAYADNAIEAWYKPQGSNSWNSIYNGIYWSTAPMGAIGSNSLFLAAGLYSVAVEWANTCGPGTQAFQISYGPSQLTAIATPSSSSVTQGGSQNVNVIASGGLTPYSYQWYEEIPGGSSFSAITGATSANYLFTTTGSTATGNYIFYANVIDSESPAASAQTNNAVVKVTTAPAPTCTSNCVWVTAMEGNKVAVVNSITLGVTNTISVSSYPVGISISPNGEYAYVASYLSSTLSTINTATHTVTNTIYICYQCFLQGVTVSPDGSSVYVTAGISNGNGPGLNTVYTINPLTDTVTNAIIVGSDPQNIAMSPNGQYAYVSNYNSGTVSVIDTATNTVTATITVGTAPTGIAVSPTGTYTYVANFGSSTISVINTATDTVTNTISTPTEPVGVALSPTGAYAYVSTESSGTVLTIDTATNTVTNTITIGNPNLMGIALSSSGAYAYVVDYDAGLYVIDTATDTVVTSTFNDGDGGGSQTIATMP